MFCLIVWQYLIFKKAGNIFLRYGKMQRNSKRPFLLIGLRLDCFLMNR